MRRSFLAAAIVPAVAFAAITFGSTKEAAAGPTIDLDLNFGTALQSQTAYGSVSRVDFSLGGGAAVGYRWNIPRSYVYLQPEIGGHYMRFGFNSAPIGYDYAGTLNAGLRAGLQGIVQPNVFGHLGFGFLGFDRGSGVTEGFLGPELDIGVGLDIRPVPGFTIGAQIAYNSVIVPTDAAPDAAKWVSFGLKAGFQFGEPRPRPVYVRRY
ncbi:Hypothetical protein A7982_08955 [Minicystis rosea]|nr:Hypothetical protein A7982_08955 [Minicystis rosea]